MGTPIYRNYKSGDVKNAQPGYAPNAWLLPISWIQTEAQPVGNAAAGDRFRITESHIAMAGKGAVAVYCPPKTVEGPGEMVGETLAKRFQWKPKVIVAGDSAELLDTVDGLINESFMLFVQDAECGENTYIQFGCVCNPCTVATGNFASGTAGEGRKQYELEMEAYTKYFYSGVLTPIDDGVDVPAGN